MWHIGQAMAVAAVLMGACPALGAVIDDFGVGDMSLTVQYGQPASSVDQPGLPTADVIGGYRHIGFGVAKAANSTVLSGAGVTMSVNGGSFIYQADKNLTAINFTLLYNGGAASPPAMDVDLAADGDTGIDLEFAYALFAPGEGHVGHLDISFSSPTGGVYQYVQVNNSAVPFSLYVPFHPANNSASFDADHVTSISIGSGQGNLYGSFALTGIQTVPEPSAVLSVLAAGVWMCRRR